jgi:hypothetical protein
MAGMGLLSARRRADVDATPANDLNKSPRLKAPSERPPRAEDIDTPPVLCDRDIKRQPSP